MYSSVLFIEHNRFSVLFSDLIGTPTGSILASVGHNRIRVQHVNESKPMINFIDRKNGALIKGLDEQIIGTVSIKLYYEVKSNDFPKSLATEKLSNLASVMNLGQVDAVDEKLNSTDSILKDTVLVDAFQKDNLVITLTLGLSLYSLSFLTILGNAMVVHVIRTERKLRTVSNMFILSLAVADLIVGLIVMPISSAYVLTRDWIFGVVVCQLWLIIDYTASTASIFNLLILSLDRYWSIKSPLKYLCKRTKKRALAMIVVVWLLAACWIVPIIGWHHWYNQGERKHDGRVCETEFSDDKLFKVTTSVVNFVIPMSLMVILYIKIYMEIKRRGKFDIGIGGGGGVAGGVAGCCKERLNDSTLVSHLTIHKSASSANFVTNFPNDPVLRASKSPERSSHGFRAFKWRDFGRTTSADFNMAKDASLGNIKAASSACNTNKSCVLGTEKCASSSVGLETSLANMEDKLPVKASMLHSEKSLTNCDSETVHRYKQLIVIETSGKTCSLQDHQDVQVQVEYVELSATVGKPKANSDFSSKLPQMTSKPLQKKTKLKMRSPCRNKPEKSQQSLASLSDRLIKGHPRKKEVKTSGRWSVDETMSENDLNSTIADFEGEEKKSKTLLQLIQTRSKGKKSPASDSSAISRSDSSVGLHDDPPTGKVAFGRRKIDRPASFSQLSSHSLPEHHLQRQNRNIVHRVESSRLRQEKKAARQLGVILGAFILCWLPYIIVFIVTAYCSCVNHFVHTIAIWLGYFNSSINPFLYALCNENFKQAFRKMLARNPCSSNSETIATHAPSFKLSKNNYT